MNCFDVKIQTCEHLLNPKTEIESHVASCASCKNQLQRCSKILDAISSRRFLKLAQVPGDSAEDISVASPKRWKNTPFVIRTSLEILGIAAFILLVVIALPRVNNYVQKKIEQSRYEDNMAELTFDSDLSFLDQQAEIDAESGGVSAVSGGTAPDSAISAIAESANTVPEKQSLNVGDSEIWRFIIKTGSPSDLVPVIRNTLLALKLGTSEDTLRGIEIPGGVQFNFLASKSLIPEIKTKLQQIAELAQKETTKTTFSWFKKKKRDIPPGQSRVVIWLSQI